MANGSTVSFSKTYTSSVSLADAQAQADGDAGFNAEGQAYANANGKCPVVVAYTQAKSEDPHVEIVLIPLVNGVNKGNVHHSTSGQIPGVFDGDTVNIILYHTPTSVAWPLGASGRLRVFADGSPIFDSTDISDVGDTLSSFSFVASSAVVHTIQTTSMGDSTSYKPVEIIQWNNSSAPMSTGQPQVVLFHVKDNTNGEMVFKDGTYLNGQSNGFNYLDTGGALADQATWEITNNHSVSLRFLLQNGTGDVTYFSNVDVAPGQTVSLTLPKESVKVTYVDTP